MHTVRGSRRAPVRRLALLSLLACAALAAACSGDTGDIQQPSPDGTGDGSAGGGDIFWPPPLADVIADTKPAPPDARPDGAPEVGPADTATGDTVPDAGVCGPSSPLFGTCESNTDCPDGLCVWDPAGEQFVCTITCLESCPCGWLCRAVAGTWPDVLSVCLPPIDRLCQPCAVDGDCINPSDLCLPIGNDPDQPRYCARGCARTGECPTGYTCTDVTDDEGAPLGRQCLPDSGSCVCTAALVGTTRPCERANEHGTCGGQQTCEGADGWGPCSAWEPAPEACNGVDDDCDGGVDEGFAYEDGAAGEKALGEACGTGLCAGGVVVCADAATATCSGLSQQTDEVCNAIDDDCDGATDEDVAGTFWQDEDRDGQGWAEVTWDGCAPPDGWVANAYDCNDQDRTIGLGFAERCDGRDNDCDGETDEDLLYVPPVGEPLPKGAECGTGLCRGGIVICAGEDAVACSTAGYAVAETCDGRDEDCDGVTDDTCDDDGDGFCDADVLVAGLPSVCPEGPGDCDDDDDTIHPGAPERCDGVDQDCDGLTDEEATDCPARRCEGAGDDYFETGAATCQDGGCVSPVPRGCRLYTCEGGGAQGDRCAETCATDAQCVASAHCDNGSCVADVVDGGACRAPNECASGHCQNGFCCAEGDCCGVADDCPDTYRTAAICDDPVTCQGHRGSATCVQSMCGSGPDVDDDSACGPAIQAIDCSPFAPLFCTGELDQFPPACADLCVADDDCVAGFHCDERCLPDRPDGGPCDEHSDCESGHCQNGFCCADGDCCQLAEDCPPEYTGAPVCETAATCQGYRVDPVCGEDAICARSERIADDAGCTPAVEALDCGPYRSEFCNGTFDQVPPECPTACVSDQECDEGAHCDGACTPDVPNGGVCDEDTDCVSAHCQNGFCCGGGVCCGEAGDCPASFREVSRCDDAATCQGHRIDATCVASVCGRSDPVPDDSGCGPNVLQSECGPYADRYCTGLAEQTVPPCPNLCGSDAGCDPGAHCDDVCVDDAVDGQACDEDSDCQSGHCQNGFCCGAGDCCATFGDCPESYGATPVCDDATTCQGHRVEPRCQAFSCTSVDVPDDSACSTLTLADDCGPYRSLYCSGAPDQTAPRCPTTCASNADCDAGSHCDGTCVSDSGAGAPCDEPSDCLSGHCQNGYCCDSGDCCATAQNCPAAYAAPSVCDSAATCQGHRIQATCQSNRCGSQSVDDDSGCGGLVSDTCGTYPTIYCTSAATQSDPPCASTCSSDADCDANAHCDGGRCETDLPQGAACDEASDCANGICVDGVCCSSSCTGTCRRCNLSGSVGTCTTIPYGQDPDSECNSAISCANYFWGWSGQSCYQRADVAAGIQSCDGTGACQDAADLCPSQGPAPTAYRTCQTPCQDRNLSTCSGQTAGQCTNLDLGSKTCGTGACYRTVAWCTNGVENTCTPGTGSTESCNNVDDDCDSQTDEGIPGWGGAYEPNNDCSTRYDFGTVAEFNSEQSWTATIYPYQDVDWYRFKAEEGTHTCVPFTSQSFSVRLRLVPPAGADCVDYDLYLYDDSCNLLRSAAVGGCTEDAITYDWGGTCTFDDDRTFRVRVIGYGTGGWECQNYRLYVDMWMN